jgi:starch synthase (maltosyl-transferring)
MHAASRDRPRLPPEGRDRVVIEAIQPSVDGGRFPAKRAVGDRLTVEADVFADGHDLVLARLLHRPPGSDDWETVPMQPLDNDRWRAEIALPRMGRHRYTVEGWTDRFATWRHDLARRLEADQDVRVELRIGADLLEAAAQRAQRDASTDGAAEAEASRASGQADATRLAEAATALIALSAGDPARRAGRRGGRAASVRAATGAGSVAATDRVTPDGPRGATSPAAPEDPIATIALDEALYQAYLRHPDLRFATRHEPDLEVVVDRLRARFGSWYELFPRSASPDPDRPGTLRDVIGLLPRLSGLGFDVLYLPPIHPIGRTFRKGPDNVETAGPGDPGSPWAIGAAEGGHTEIHPELGTLDDFSALVAAAGKLDMEIALDLAFQASPDHPAVTDHPEWFRHRPDGTVQYAENPPKKYQDIYPFDFETEAWSDLWSGLEAVVETWIERGVHIFRVDNPHTKPFPFWEWLIGSVKARHPEVLFLAEAFTRPKIMYRLAKLGFSQSYTYFTWRTTKAELQAYFEELSHPPVVDFFRPNLWPNTPDILHEVLQLGGRPAFALRAFLAATLGASWGVYGPPFESLEAAPLKPGTEEYLHAEKYEIRHWALDAPGSLAGFLGRLNAIRRAQPALQRDDGLTFLPIDGDQLLAYTKQAPGAPTILCIVNLDHRGRRQGMVDLPLERFGLPTDGPFPVRDLLDGSTYLWQGPRNYVELDPEVRAGHVFILGERLRTEGSFEYYR